MKVESATASANGNSTAPEAQSSRVTAEAPAEAGDPISEAVDAMIETAADIETPGTPAEESPEQLRKRMAEIEQAERVVSNRLSAWESAKAEASEAKKAYDVAVTDMCDIVRRHNTPLPLFDGVTATDAAEPAAPEAWRSVPLADIGLDAKLVTKLADHTPSLTTLGELADFTAQPLRRLTDIDGIGPSAAEKIENALMTYWNEHPLEKPAEKPAPVLKWEPIEDVNAGFDAVGGFYATNTAGIETDADIHADFVITPADGSKFDVTSTDSVLMPDANPGTFDTIDAARDWAEGRNAELLASKAAAKPKKKASKKKAAKKTAKGKRRKVLPS